MAANALIKFTQLSSSPGDGIAMVGVTGQAVTVENSDNTEVAHAELFLLYTDPSNTIYFDVSATVPWLSADGPLSLTFTPQYGCYRFMLKVWSFIPSGSEPPDSVDIRVIGVPLPNGILPPPAQFNPPPLPDPATGLPNAKPNEMNFNGQPWGWSGMGFGNGDGLLNDALGRLFAGSRFQRWVDSGTTATVNAGTEQLPYTNIQAAFDYISAHEGIDTWWTVNLAARHGGYEEALLIPDQRQIALVSQDYNICTINTSGLQQMQWNLSGSNSYLALKGMQVHSVQIADTGSQPTNFGTLFLDDASIETVTSGTYTADLVAVGPRSYVETGTFTGRVAVDGIDHVGNLTCGADFICYDTLIPGSTVNIGGSLAVISDTQIDAGSTLNFTGYAPVLYVDSVSKYWIDANSVTITGSPTIVVMAPDTISGFPGKDITPQGSSYTLVAGDAGKTLFTTSSANTLINFPDNSTVPFPIGTTIHFQQQYFGVMTLFENGSTILLSRTSKQTANTNSVIWAIKVDTNTWALGGDLLDAPPVYNLTGSSNTLAYVNAGRLTSISNSTSSNLVVPTNAGFPIPIGASFEFVQEGLGSIVFAPQDGTVTINSGLGNLTLNQQWARAILTKTGTNQWQLNRYADASLGRLTIVTESSGTRTLTAADAGCYIRCTNAGGCVVTVNTAIFNPGDSVMFRQVAAGAISFTGSATVTAPVTNNAVSGQQGATIALVFDTANTADVMGDLQDI